MKRFFTLFISALVLSTTLQAQLVIKKDDYFKTADQMLLANELFLSGEPFAESLGYNLDDLNPMQPNLPDSVSYATGIEGYEYSRYLLGNVVSRSGIGLHMIWSPRVGQMAAMQPDTFDGKFTNGMVNGYKEDDQMMMMIHHFGMLANQMAPMNPFPQFADFESGNPQLPQDVEPDFQSNFSSLRWDRSEFSKVLNLAAMGQSLWKQYYWAQDMLGGFHNGNNEEVVPDGTVSPDSADSPNFDPNNDVFYGGNSVDGFIGQVLTAEGINKVIFMLNNLAYDGTSLGMVDPATYDPANGINYFPHKIAVTESIVHETMPPKPTALEVTDASSQLFDQLSMLLGTVSYKNMMDPNINDEQHYAFHEVFDGDPFPAPMSVTSQPGPFDAMAGASMVLFKNIMAMHFNQNEGTFTNESGLSGGSVSQGNEISAVNAGYILVALNHFKNEFTGTPLEQMATDAINAQAGFIINSLHDENGGYYNAYTIGSGPDNSSKEAASQGAIIRGLYAAYDATGNIDYLDAANSAYQYLISGFYVNSLTAFRTVENSNTAEYTPFNLAVLSGALREATLVGEQPSAEVIYTRFFKTVYNPMVLAEFQPSGETGNDSDGDGIPYIADGNNVAAVFAAEAEMNLHVTAVNSIIQQQANLQIYPNPVSHQATISFNNKDFGNTSVSVVNIAGQTVQHINTSNNRNVNWNVQELNNGIYFVRLENEGRPVAIQKVIVNK